jgi:hypothetical protein
MSATTSGRLAGLVDRLDVAIWQTEHRDGRILGISGEIGYIRPRHGELIVTIVQRTSAALIRQLLRAGVLGASRSGELKIERIPSPVEAVTLRDALGLHRRRT